MKILKSIFRNFSSSSAVYRTGSIFTTKLGIPNSRILLLSKKKIDKKTNDSNYWIFPSKTTIDSAALLFQSRIADRDEFSIRKTIASNSKKRRNETGKYSTKRSARICDVWIWKSLRVISCISKSVTHTNWLRQSLSLAWSARPFISLVRGIENCCFC